ncbi:hypothetical protein N7366_24190 [Aeromonas caviae]|nr:hypothetical protein [Aeromonas caviae]
MKPKFSANKKRQAILRLSFWNVSATRAVAFCYTNSISSPSDPCYASITHYGEGGSEADFYICKHCLRSKHHARYIGEEGYHQGYSKFNQWKRRAALAPEQHICDYCDSVVTGDCDCKGATYWREQATAV